MARRGRSRRSGGFGGLGRSGGMLPAPMKSIAAGWGAASILEMFGVGGLLPGAAAGFLVGGGLTGAAGGAGKTLLKGVDMKGVGSQIGSNMIG